MGANVTAENKREVPETFKDPELTNKSSAGSSRTLRQNMS